MTGCAVLHVQIQDLADEAGGGGRGGGGGGGGGLIVVIVIRRSYSRYLTRRCLSEPIK